MTEQDPQVPPQTPPLNPLQAALAGVRDLADRVAALTVEVAKLRTYGRRNRWFVVADIVLTVLVAAFGYLSVHTANAAHENGVTIAQLHASQIQGCRVNNDAKAKQAALWAFVVAALQPPASDTPAQKAAAQKFLAKLERHIDSAYMVRDCQQAYKAH